VSCCNAKAQKAVLILGLKSSRSYDADLKPTPDWKAIARRSTTPASDRFSPPILTTPYLKQAPQMSAQLLPSTPNGDIDRQAGDVTPLGRSFDQEGQRIFPDRSRAKFPMFNLGGIRVQAITQREILAIISEAARSQEKYVVANHNMHSLYLWHRDSKMRGLYARADYTHIDGLPLIPLFRLFGFRLKREHRIAYIDFWPVLATEAIKQGWRIYYLGSEPGIAEKGADRLLERHPSLHLRTHHGYFDTHGAENEAVLADIRAYAPAVLLVGMGMPRQEAWVDENLDHISARTIFSCCGCTMEYFAGKIPTCPRWLGNIGFEWLYRLFAEPTRLWRRYLVEPWFVFGQLINAYVKFGRKLGASTSIIEHSDK
jgi:N-acetylglucosaminyldiphosphoundecaprenol N-acetyl-beta-D-mannosaminyltransferase